MPLSLSLPHHAFILLILSLLHSLSSSRPLPSHNTLLSLILLLPPAIKVSGYYSTVSCFSGLTILFDVIYCIIHGNSITSYTAGQDASSGVKFCFAVYILTMLYKVFVTLFLVKYNVDNGAMNNDTPYIIIHVCTILIFNIFKYN